MAFSNKLFFVVVLVTSCMVVIAPMAATADVLCSYAFEAVTIPSCKAYLTSSGDDQINFRRCCDSLRNDYYSREDSYVGICRCIEEDSPILDGLNMDLVLSLPLKCGSDLGIGC
ncbi:hypothetical protein CCACVL1_22761 [Corchorus capsularis]|uniref:Bifunctional inhibitor/plant lipid transfer protein/seed storage helical domain-containing protein n=1 Tax=Corchorus capsularis TaxID=210143 RepID=A0A1R3GWR6_COCAP|nr:hypothetical protein CCACVL1_22761 [Corchorus capsularis]